MTTVKTQQAPRKKQNPQTIFWWIGWITLTICSFFVASAFWTPIITKHFGSIRETKASVLWVTAVFGSWLVMLFPLIIVMYYKVDKAYEDARLKREKSAMRFKSILVDKTKRLLSREISDKLQNVPETVEGGHLVTVVLRDGRKFENVFVQSKNEILGIYNVREFPFTATDVIDLTPVGPQDLPLFTASQWLRLDGVNYPE